MYLIIGKARSIWFSSSISIEINFIIISIPNAKQILKSDSENRYKWRARANSVDRNVSFINWIKWKNKNSKVHIPSAIQKMSKYHRLEGNNIKNANQVALRKERKKKCFLSWHDTGELFLCAVWDKKKKIPFWNAKEKRRWNYYNRKCCLTLHRQEKKMLNTQSKHIYICECVHKKFFSFNYKYLRLCVCVCRVRAIFFRLFLLLFFCLYYHVTCIQSQC